MDLILSLLFFAINLNGYVRAFQCMNEFNKPVDWLVIYKLPKLVNANKHIEDGVGYVYQTSENHAQWSFSQVSINDSGSIIGNTLANLYSDNDSQLYILYNDQPPNEPSNASNGHTKGVIMANSTGGFWLVHSVPHFPPISAPYEFPSSGMRYGQSFLCISINLENLNRVGVQLQYNQPQVFAKNLPNQFHAKLEELIKAGSDYVIQEPPWFHRITISSLKGTTFSSFAKSGKFSKDLYEDWVAPSLKSDLFVETWPNGAGKLASNCSKPFKVYNIETVDFDFLDVSFNNTHDHSKWALSENASWVCIGDINRMEHQKIRGGGTMCLNNEALANNYRNSVKTVEKCTKSF